MHVQGRKSSNLFGFYLWIQGPWVWDGTLIPHAHPPEGLFTIIDTICLHVESVYPDKWGVASDQEHDPSLVYDYMITTVKIAEVGNIMVVLMRIICLQS